MKWKRVNCMICWASWHLRVFPADDHQTPQMAPIKGVNASSILSAVHIIVFICKVYVWNGVELSPGRKCPFDYLSAKQLDNVDFCEPRMWINMQHRPNWSSHHQSPSASWSSSCSSQTNCAALYMSANMFLRGWCAALCAPPTCSSEDDASKNCPTSPAVKWQTELSSPQQTSVLI